MTQEALMPLPKGEEIKKSKNIIGFILEEIFEERDLTINKVSFETGIAYNTIRDWLNGTSKPTTDDDLLTISMYLNLSITYLCYGIGSDEPAYLDENGNPKKFRRKNEQ